MSQWEENMEYLEAYDDAELEGQEYIDQAYEYWESFDESEAKDINRKLDILDLDRIARENGEKPASEWGRRDFKNLLHRYPKVRHLRTCELRAFFLYCEDFIDGVKYYERVNGHNLYDTNLAVPPLVVRQMDENHYASQRWWFEDKKLWNIWRKFVRRSKYGQDH